jgi:hypothetical protein
MPQKDRETTSPDPMKPEEAAELERALQEEEIAPVDRATFGRRLAEIIVSALRNRWNRD